MRNGENQHKPAERLEAALAETIANVIVIAESRKELPGYLHKATVGWDRSSAVAGPQSPTDVTNQSVGAKTLLITVATRAVRGSKQDRSSSGSHGDPS